MNIERQKVDKVLKANGLTLNSNTGGGCEAWYRQEDKRHCFVTLSIDGTEVPSRLNDLLMVGIQTEDENGDLHEIFMGNDLTLDDAMEMVRDWMDDFIKHPCEINGHRNDGRDWCVECQQFVGA
jgi:hypothetical protein